MARSKFVNTVEDTTQVAARKASEAIVEAAERLAPLIDQAGDYLGPLTEEARRLSSELASDAYSRVKPVLRDAQIRGARLASGALGKVQPVIDDALHSVPPVVDHAVGTVRPVVDDVLGRIPPIVEGARHKVQDDVLPRVAGVLREAASQPLAAEAATQLALATAVVSKEIRKARKASQRKARRWPGVLGKLMLAGALAAGVAVAIRKLLTPPSEGWHAHSPSDAYVADPIGEPSPAEAAAETVEQSAEAVSGLAEETADRVGEAAESAADWVGERAEDAAEATDEAAESVTDLAEDAAEQVDEATGEGDDAAPFAGSPFGEESYQGSEPPEGFVVKANTRTRKYRAPGSAGYERAVADVWFTSADAAQAAGFVKAQR